MSAPLQVYCFGISPPAAKAELVTAKVMEVSAGAEELPCCATVELTAADSSSARVISISIAMGRIGNPPFPVAQYTTGLAGCDGKPVIAESSLFVATLSVRR